MVDWERLRVIVLQNTGGLRRRFWSKSMEHPALRAIRDSLVFAAG